MNTNPREPEDIDDGDNDQNYNADDELNTEPTGTDLKYDADEDSYEIEVPSDDPDYDPPSLFDTAAPGGSDMNSDYDEANPYDIQGEYDRKRSIETDADALGMHVEDEEAEEVDPIDKALSHTPEDDRDDLDEEGYPKNDTPEK